MPPELLINCLELFVNDYEIFITCLELLRDICFVFATAHVVCLIDLVYGSQYQPISFQNIVSALFDTVGAWLPLFTVNWTDLFQNRGMIQRGIWTKVSLWMCIANASHMVPVCIVYVCTVHTAYGSLMTHVVKNMLGYVICMTWQNKLSPAYHLLTLLNENRRGRETHGMTQG